MSRRPGIGKNWYQQYKQDVYPSDEIIIKGKKLKVPKFYDSIYELENPVQHAVMKVNRKKNAEKHEINNTPVRLKIRETIQERKLNQLKRNLHAN